MTTLAAMITLLQSEVPAVSGVPTSDQYAQAIKDAVIDFSRRCGLVKIATLSIVAGTSVYILPADFARMIMLNPLVPVDGVIISDGDLIPVNASMIPTEQYTIANGQITFYPIPRYTLTRYFKYKAAWVATDGDYTLLGEDETQVVMLKAKANALEKITNSQADISIKYSFGAVSEDLGGTSQNFSKSMENTDKKYLDACDTYNGSHWLVS